MPGRPVTSPTTRRNGSAGPWASWSGTTRRRYSTAARKLWSIPVVVSNTVAVGIAALLDTTTVRVDVDTLGVQVEWSESVSDDFEKNMVRARCGGRFSCSVTRASVSSGSRCLRLRSSSQGCPCSACYETRRQPHRVALLVISFARRTMAGAAPASVLSDCRPAPTVSASALLIDAESRRWRV